LEVAPGVLRRFQWEHGQESENTGMAMNFGIEQKLQVASIEVKPVVGASKASILPHESKFGFEVKIQPSFLACLRFARSL